MVNRNPLANVGAVKVGRGRRQAVVGVGGVAILLRGRCRSRSADLSVHRFAGDPVAIGVHVSRLPVVLVVGACLLNGPPGRLHRGAILANHQLDGPGGAGPVVVATSVVLVAASVVVVASVVAGATVGKGCAWPWSLVGDEQAASSTAPTTTSFLVGEAQFWTACGAN
jgi:hypothetical protein